MRPDYPSIVYTKILKELFPDTPVILGGIEASMRRITHYDYWQDKLKKCILCESGADCIVYGMGEKPMTDIARTLDEGQPWEAIRNIPQTVFLCRKEEIPGGIKDDDIILHSHEECLKNKKAQAENFKHVEVQSNMMHAKRMLQMVDGRYTVVNPPYPPMTTAELDASFDLPYMRLPHPKYKGKTIPAFEMIKFSVCLHRGCFGGCAFCTISAHQGKFITSRSKESIIKEVKKVIQMPGFKGYISDLGGPSANMYRMGGKNKQLCEKCARPSCLHPRVCKNLNTDPRPLIDIYRSVDKLPGIKKSFIGSGVRYDIILHHTDDEEINKANREYAEELICNHVSGRLKVAPEHTSDEVLMLMRKPSFQQFHQFKEIFDRINKKHGLNQQIIPYFISSHPGCREEDMAELAAETKEMDFHLEQVQDFTPTPMTVSTETWYTGFDPYSLKPIFCVKTPAEKERQRMFFFWYKPEERQKIQNELRKIGREDLIQKLYGRLTKWQSSKDEPQRGNKNKNRDYKDRNSGYKAKNNGYKDKKQGQNRKNKPK